MCLKILRMISIGTTSIMRREIVSEYLSPPQLRPTLILMVALCTRTFIIKDIIFGLIVVQKSKKDIFLFENEIVFIGWIKKESRNYCGLAKNFANLNIQAFKHAYCMLIPIWVQHTSQIVDARRIVCPQLSFCKQLSSVVNE